MSANPPPSKKEQLLKLLERGSVFVHLDPRRSGVMVPPWLTNKHQLVLQLGLNFPIPIRDLEIDDEGVRCTLSFNRSPFYCVLPWHAVYALVTEDGQVTVWPSELPLELAPEANNPNAGTPATRKNGPKERRARTEPTSTSTAKTTTPNATATPPREERPAPAPVRSTPSRPKIALVPAPPPAPESEASKAESTEEPAKPAAESPSPSATPSEGTPRPSRPPYLRLVK